MGVPLPNENIAENFPIEQNHLLRVDTHLSHTLEGGGIPPPLLRYHHGATAVGFSPSELRHPIAFQTRRNRRHHSALHMQKNIKNETQKKRNGQR